MTFRTEKVKFLDTGTCSTLKGWFHCFSYPLLQATVYHKSRNSHRSSTHKRKAIKRCALARQQSTQRINERDRNAIGKQEPAKQPEGQQPGRKLEAGGTIP
ncbi:hypothetical protein I79_018900 [Cricetulus griseus]|uniref:Uncharacterized protein n=1 Tax=Cricetulus griseus TaxID=10029 RepID=G3I5Y9_CRIGR|nr:hypothetical protein I79_018900 [Cricetulus griseus]